MADPVSLTTQTIYAELVDRCSAAAFDAEFPLNGSFVRVTVKDRNYWYFQAGTRDASGKQPRKYVGPDTPEIQQRITKHGQAKNDYRERRHLVATLRRERFQGPLDDAGRALVALSAAGVFRMRVCLIGTAAYQVYAPLLGVRLPRTTLQTGDLDIAQFTAISLAISKDDQTPPLLEILHKADASYRAVPHPSKAEASASYVNANGFRVDVLTENRGPDRDTPKKLPAIGTHAQPLRFLDFLIREEVPAVVLYDAGVLVNVPAPARYAVHKLIVSQRRREGAAKSDKDILQAEALLSAIAQRRPADLRELWNEAIERGRKWQDLLTLGLTQIAASVRDRVLHVLGTTRSALPGLDLKFSDAPPRYDFSREVVMFEGKEGDQRVVCAISREALEDHYKADNLTQEQRIEVFRRNRREIQEMARIVYLDMPIPLDGSVLITTEMVAALRHRIEQPRTPFDRRTGD